ncbi:MAG: SAM-dependent methyltransferase, partial [Trebonia sp.]
MASDEAAVRGTSMPQAGRLPFDTSKAHQARMYDYLLDGKDNYAADRAATTEWLNIDPGIAFTVRSNRAFLGRAVRYLTAEAGIRQFLDIGTGIPTAGNTHEAAQVIAPESRVVYVDYDPVVLAHARALLTSSEVGTTEYIDADLRDTGTILDQAKTVLDFTRPVAITLIAILHAIPDADDPHAIVATLLDAVPPGSYLAVTHLGADLLDRDKREGIVDVADRMVQQKPVYRTRDQVARFFDGMDLVAPG